MIQAKTAMIDKQQTSQKDVKFFAAENKLIPIQRITHQSITQIEDFREEQIIPEQKVHAIIRERKKSNPFSKFFNKILKYVDKLEDFIETVQKLQLKSITQKKILLQSEKTDQNLRTYQSKRLVKSIKESEKETEEEAVNLKDNPQLGSLLASALGLTAASVLGAGPAGATEVYGEVATAGEFEIAETATQAPAWIPFPKGTTGLVFTSGFKMRWGRPHKGIDIASAQTGKPIITPITGVVTEAGWDSGGYGYKVVVKSGQLQMLFGHLLSQPPVRAGQNVTAGTVIGLLGNTGRSTGPHLHWEVIVNGSHVDPSAWTRSNPPGTSTAGATSNPNVKPMEPSNHPSRKTNNESEGGINISRRIMMGEAGVEFAIPISQMPTFIQAMLEEKIRSLNPNYTGTEQAKVGFETTSGSAQTKFASGAVVLPYNQNHYTAAKKLKGLFPQAKDYHIAAAMGNFETESTGMYPNRYQGDYSTPPTWKKPSSGPGRGIAQWEVNHAGNNFNGRWSQGLKKFGPSLFTDINKQLEFVKWEMDSNTKYLPWGNSTKREWLQSTDLVSATKNFLEGYEAPSIPHMEGRIARAFSFQRNMKKLLGIVTPAPQKPKQEKNIFQKFMDMVAPSKRAANLDSVDNQMEIAKDYQKQFTFENATNEIIALYKPTVYYSEV